MNDSIKIKGYGNLTCYRKDGSVKWSQDFTNLITSAGKAAFIGLIGDVGSVDSFGYLALGTSSTAVTTAQTTLGAEITDSGLARSAATVSRTTTTVSNDTLTLTHQFLASGAKIIEEIGIFNASSAGVMAGRALTTSKSVESGESITCTYNIQMT